MCFLPAVWCNLICSWSFRSNSTVPFLQTCGPWFPRKTATKWIMLCVEFFRALICSWQLSFIASWQIQKLGFSENDSFIDGLGYQPKASIFDEPGRSLSKRIELTCEMWIKSCGNHACGWDLVGHNTMSISEELDTIMGWQQMFNLKTKTWSFRGGCRHLSLL